MMTRIIKTKGLLMAAVLFTVHFSLFTSCSSDIHAPVLPSPTGTAITTDGFDIDESKLFGVWGATTVKGPANGVQFEQSYRIEFQSVEDAEAVVSHWYTDASTEIEDSVYQAEYTYSLNGGVVELTPKSTARAAGASPIKAVYIGNNQMVLYTINENFTDTICTLNRIGDPEPSITSVDRTMPNIGETVTITGRNLQFVDHVYLPGRAGDIEVKNFKSGSKQIQFTLPNGNYANGSIRCQSSSAHVSCYSPAYMFCRRCVFMRSFNNFGAKSPYTGTEFEYTISSMGNLRDNVSPISSRKLPAGHSLNFAANSIVNPDSLLSFFGDAPVSWPSASSTDPSTGYLRFSSADRFQYVVDNSDGIVGNRSRCHELALQMEVYVFSDGEPKWDTGYFSYRLNKDQSSLTSPMIANVAMWDRDTPARFDDGWKTLTIPLTAFSMIAGDGTLTLSGLIGQLKSGNLQTIIKVVNYPLDELHPTQDISSFQFCIANLRLVPYGTPANTKD